MTIAVHHADCVAWLTEYAARVAAGGAEPFDSCATDPPYHLASIVKRFGKQGSAAAKVPEGGTGAYARASKGFMGKEWDGGDVAFRAETWRAVFDCLKPGAHLVAFSGTRTYHRMACAIEDAGFEIRDQLAWAYGTGFPKSHDVGLAIDKMNGAPPRAKAFNMEGRGDRAKELDTNGREFLPPYQPANPDAAEWQGWGTALKPAWEPICLARKPLSEKSVAANVLRWGTGAINIDGCRIGAGKNTPASPSTKSSLMSGLAGGEGKTPGDVTGSGFDPNIGRWPANIVHDGSADVLAGFPDTAAAKARTGRRSGKASGILGEFIGQAEVEMGHNDPGGSAARFFYSAKAGPLDRLGSKHATVKPVDLMRWLCRMVTPPGGHILDPFAGSGTTGIAAMAEGFGCTMIDLEVEHVTDIERKLAFLRGEGSASLVEHTRHLAPAAADDMGPLFSAGAA